MPPTFSSVLIDHARQAAPCYNPDMNQMVLAADPIGVIGATAAVLGALATLFVGWLGWRAVVPHRVMTYGLEVTPLLSEDLPNLTVSLGDRPLEHPHTATVRIRNVGNREIEPSAFNGEPLELEMNARIVSVLTRDAGQHRRVPPTSARGGVLYVDPYVIPKDQTLVYKLLLDGAEPEVTPRHSLSATLRERREPNVALRMKVGVGLGILVVLMVPLSVLWLQSALNTVEHDLKHDRTIMQKLKDEGYKEGQSDAQRGIHRSHAAPIAFP